MLDMSNATAGGPAYGLLDMIFGSKPKEASGADGKDFEGLMSFLKALNEAKNGDSPEADIAGWTGKGTSDGKNAVDYRFANIPSLFAMMMNPELPQQAATTQLGERLQALLASNGRGAAVPTAPASSAVAARLIAERMEQVANSSPEMRALYEAAKEIAALKTALAEKRLDAKAPLVTLPERHEMEALMPAMLMQATVPGTSILPKAPLSQAPIPAQSAAATRYEAAKEIAALKTAVAEKQLDAKVPLPERHEMEALAMPAVLAQQASAWTNVETAKSQAPTPAQSAAAARLIAERMEQVANSSPEMRALYEAAKEIAALKAAIAEEQVDPNATQVALPPYSEMETSALGVLAQAVLSEQKRQATPKNGSIAMEQIPPELLLAKGLAGEEGMKLQDSESMKKLLRELAQAKDGAKVSEKNVGQGDEKEKILSTESYLEMHKMAQTPAAGKNQLLEPRDAEGKVLGQAERRASASETKGVSAVSLAAVAGLEGGKAGLTKQNQKEEGDQPTNGKETVSGQKSLRPEDLGRNFSATLDTTIKEGAGAIVAKNIFLPSHKPEDMRLGLVQELSQSVHLQAVKGGGEMRMVLHPESLGELRLKVGAKDGKVEVAVMAENEEAAGLLRKSVQDLASSLGDRNLTLAKFEVQVSDKRVSASLDTQSGGMDQSFQRQSHHSSFNFMNGGDGRSAQWDSQEFGQRSYRGLVKPEDEAAPIMSRASPTRVRDSSSRQRLDIVA